jgi:acetylornithine deacetylase/succinyl-diaminopimelate desuccinylase-like protein
MLVFAALDGLIQREGKPPVNVKILLEGEEESGGESVDEFVHAHGDKLSADVALICDTHMVSAEQPSIINGLRGILYTEIKVWGAKSDLHSGVYGGVAPNPIHALCVLISRLKGEDGRINIKELQAAIPPVSTTEKSFWQDDPLDIQSSLLEEMGVDVLVGEEDYPPLERVGVRPTLEVHGIRGGFIADGAKTVIPAEALAKLSLRVPAGISTDDAFLWLQKAVSANIPKGHRVLVENLAGGEGVAVSIDNTYIQAAAASLESIYSIQPVYMREGGSIPIAALFDNVLKLPVVLMGFGLPDDGLHAPNEKFSLEQFRKGMKTIADYLTRIASQ